MGRYRKVPVEIEASQWHRHGDHPEVTLLEHQPACKTISFPCSQCGGGVGVHGWVDTLEGGHVVCPGDWIITGVEGEHYPCKHHIFDATYEPVTGE